MDRNLRLRDYPCVVVRFACRDCPRIGRYRQAYLPDLLNPSLPDLPAAAGKRLRVIGGGNA